jgi:hypothetical protein
MEDCDNHDAFFFPLDGDACGVSSVVLKAQCPCLWSQFRAKQIGGYSDLLGDFSSTAIKKFFELLHTGLVPEGEAVFEVHRICDKFNCNLIPSDWRGRFVEVSPRVDASSLKRENLPSRSAVSSVDDELGHGAPTRANASVLTPEQSSE